MTQMTHYPGYLVPGMRRATRDGRLAGGSLQPAETVGSFQLSVVSSQFSVVGAPGPCFFLCQLPLPNAYLFQLTPTNRAHHATRSANPMPRSPRPDRVQWLTGQDHFHDAFVVASLGFQGARTSCYEGLRLPRRLRPTRWIAGSTP